MARLILCDGCGELMDYAHLPPAVTGEEIPLTLLPATQKNRSKVAAIKVSVTLRIRPHNENGGHTDLCGKCRHDLVLRALATTGDSMGLEG